MGGHGALWLAIRHKDVFGAGGSTSGGVDIRPFPKNWEMSKQLGEYEADSALWDQHTVITQIDKITDGDLALIIDCGEKDFFLEVNKALHKALLEKNISHDLLLVLVHITGNTGITLLITKFFSLINSSGNNISIYSIVYFMVRS